MISSDEIVAITQNVMGTMFELCPMTDESHTELLEGAEAFTGCVQISGQWKGAVVLQGTPELAKIIAANFFELTADEVTEADIRDSVAELTNMVGGNIKGQVPAPSYLSIPSVTTGSDFSFHLAGASVVSEVVVTCEGQLMRIRLCEADQGQA